MSSLHNNPFSNIGSIVLGAADVVPHDGRTGEVSGLRVRRTHLLGKSSVPDAQRFPAIPSHSHRHSSVWITVARGYHVNKMQFKKFVDANGNYICVARVYITFHCKVDWHR